MLIYNVTTKVEWPVAEQWVEWMKNVHIPEIINTGCFSRFQFVRLMETDEEDGPTYAIQYFADSRADYNNYIYSFEDKQLFKTYDRWGDKVVTFRSLMQIVI